MGPIMGMGSPGDPKASTSAGGSTTVLQPRQVTPVSILCGSVPSNSSGPIQPWPEEKFDGSGYGSAAASSESTVTLVPPTSEVAGEPSDMVDRICDLHSLCRVGAGAFSFHHLQQMPARLVVSFLKVIRSRQDKLSQGLSSSL